MADMAMANPLDALLMLASLDNQARADSSPAAQAFSGGTSPTLAQVKAEAGAEAPMAEGAAHQTPAHTGLEQTEWVQCEAPGCGKWRVLPRNMSAASLPDRFECRQMHWIQGAGAGALFCALPETTVEAPSQFLEAPDEDSDGGESKWGAKRHKKGGKRGKSDGVAKTREKRRADQSDKPQSNFVGVAWRDRESKWQANLHHQGKNHHLGYYENDHEAAQTFDLAARKVRGELAHGGRSGPQWWRLNFPDAAEIGFAANAGMPTLADKLANSTATKRSVAAVAARAEEGKKGASDYLGVSWNKEKLRWKTQVREMAFVVTSPRPARVQGCISAAHFLSCVSRSFSPECV